MKKNSKSRNEGYVAILAKSYEQGGDDRSVLMAVMGGIDSLPDTDEVYSETKALMQRIIRDHGTEEALRSNRDPLFAYLMAAMMHRSVMDPSPIPWLEQALRLLGEGESDEVLEIKIRHILANQYSLAGHGDKAVQMYEAEEKLQAAHGSEWDRHNFWSKMNQATVHHDNGDMDAASRKLRDACNILLRIGPRSLGECREILIALAGFDEGDSTLYSVINEYVPAVLLQLESYVESAEESPLEKADVMERIADVTGMNGSGGLHAIRRYRIALALREKAGGRDDVQNVELLRQLAGALERNEDYEEAAFLMERVLEAASGKRAKPEERRNIPYALSSLSECHRALGNEKLADKYKAQLDAYYAEEDKRGRVRAKK